MTPCSCGVAEVFLQPTPNGPHHAKRICAECGRCRGWEPKPRQPLEAGKPALHLGETVTVLWLKNGWAGLEGSDGRTFSKRTEHLKGLAL